MPAEVCIIRAYRGHVAEARDVIDRFERQFDDIADPQIHLSLLKAHEHLALAEGDLGESIRIGREADLLVDRLGVEGLSSESLACAVEARDADRVGEVVAALIRNGRAGRISLAIQQAASGAQRVLGGDRSALVELDRASDVVRADGVRFDLALLLRSRVLLAPDDPGAQAAAEESRAILTDLGAVTLLRGLPAPVDTSPDPEPRGGQTAPADVHASTDPGTAGVAPS